MASADAVAAAAATSPLPAAKETVEFGPVLPANVKQLRMLTMSVFPVRYSDKFYNDIVREDDDTASRFTFFSYYRQIAVGALCSRLETITDAPGSLQLYLMTVGVLAAYRSRGIGSALMQHLLQRVSKDERITRIYLHVQVGNEDALKFYKKFGFQVIGEEKGYYQRVTPPDAWILEYKPASST